LSFENVVCILIFCFVMFLIIREKIQDNKRQREKYKYLRGILRGRKVNEL